MQVSLRPWHKSDVETLALAANNRLIAQFMTDTFPHPYQLSDAERFIEWSTNNCPSVIRAIQYDNTIVGSIGIHPQQDIMRKNAEIGYWLSEAYWNRGIATEAIRQMIPIAFELLPVNRIFARTFGNNLASQKALLKAGFEKEGYFSKTIFKNGQFFDEVIYARRK